MLFKKIIYLIDGKREFTNIWDFLLFRKRTFLSNEDIEIPSDKVLVMNSPKIDGEIKIDGELYIL